MCLYAQGSFEERFFLACYLDHFVGVELSNLNASQAYARFSSLAHVLGLALAPEKCVPPITSLIFPRLDSSLLLLGRTGALSL